MTAERTVLGAAEKHLRGYMSFMPETSVEPDAQNIIDDAFHRFA